MALTNSAVASPRQLYQGSPGTTITTLFTSASASANVTSPSATAYITEIIITNVTSASATISIYIGGSADSNAIIKTLPIPPNDAKFISGIKTMIPAGSTIQALQGTSSALTLTISGCEVQ